MSPCQKVLDGAYLERGTLWPRVVKSSIQILLKHFRKTESGVFEGLQATRVLSFWALQGSSIWPANGLDLSTGHLELKWSIPGYYVDQTAWCSRKSTGLPLNVGLDLSFTQHFCTFTGLWNAPWREALQACQPEGLSNKDTISAGMGILRRASFKRRVLEKILKVPDHSCPGKHTHASVTPEATSESSSIRHPGGARPRWLPLQAFGERLTLTNKEILWEPRRKSTSRTLHLPAGLLCKSRRRKRSGWGRVAHSGCSQSLAMEEPTVLAGWASPTGFPWAQTKEE